MSTHGEREWIITAKPAPYGDGHVIGRVQGARRHDAWITAVATYGVRDGQVLMMPVRGGISVDLAESIMTQRMIDNA